MFVEERRINDLLKFLQENNKLSQKTYNYLQTINDEYHSWISSEIEKFNHELNSLNESGYQEVIDTLEQKYQQNSGKQ
ncbi:hypothetical protein J9303_12395 [Bacillaceae bacterium Marseille-Q3522]|nr:hypothetical protein [Bacillaceae bacterium Marseille-Q3522]